MKRDKKIKSLDDLVPLVVDLKRQGKVIVQCHGAFDLMHPGHIEHLKTAKEQGDILVVSVTADALIHKGPGWPIFNQNIRMQSIAALGAVDYVVLDQFGAGPPLIERIKPDVYVKGPDHEADANAAGNPLDPERRAVEAVGGRFFITHDDVVFSSTELLNRHFSPFPEEVGAFLEHFKKIHTYHDVDGWLKKLAEKRVLIVGDTIVDEYHYSRPLGMSAKENLISVNYESEESFAGGALATANHLAGFCKEVGLFSMLGKDNSREDFIRAHLEKNVKPFFVYREDGPTAVIRRYVEKVFLMKYFQLYFHNPLVSEELDMRVALSLEPLLASYDVVLANDFGLGFLSRHSIELMCKKANFLAVNTQTNSSNRGYNLITKYPRADYGCIDEPEIRLATHNRNEPIEGLIKEIVSRLHASAFTTTLGHRGSIGHDAKTKTFYKTPILSDKIIDRVGAGDAYFSITAPLVALGAPMDIVGFIGNAMGAIAVTIRGNERSIHYPELSRALYTMMR